MYPGTHISRLYRDGTVLPAETEPTDSEVEDTIAFWKSSTGRLRLAAGTKRRKGEESVLLTEKEAESLGYRSGD